MRKLKKVRKKKSGTSGPVYVSHWCFFEVLSFLEDTVKHKQYVLSYKYYSVSELITEHTATLQLLQHPVKTPFLHQILYQRMKYLICKLVV